MVGWHSWRRRRRPDDVGLRGMSWVMKDGDGDESFVCVLPEVCREGMSSARQNLTPVLLLAFRILVRLGQ